MRIIFFAVFFLSIMSCTHFDYVTKWTDLDGNIANAEQLEIAMDECKYWQHKHEYYARKESRESTQYNSIYDRRSNSYYDDQPMVAADTCMKSKGFEERKILKNELSIPLELNNIES
ncbi:hypothetical protein NBRC116495_00620 [Aurantivibrio plasticivorans]